MYSYWKPGMEIYVSHVGRKNLPSFVTPETSKRLSSKLSGVMRSHSNENLVPITEKKRVCTSVSPEASSSSPLSSTEMGTGSESSSEGSVVIDDDKKDLSFSTPVVKSCLNYGSSLSDGSGLTSEDLSSGSDDGSLSNSEATTMEQVLHMDQSWKVGHVAVNNGFIDA